MHAAVLVHQAIGHLHVGQQMRSLLGGQGALLMGKITTHMLQSL